MEKEFLLNACIQPTLQFNNQFSSLIMPAWQTLTSTMEIQPHDCFLSTPPPPTPTKDNYESTLSSMVSSPIVSSLTLSSDNTIIRELIDKLGNILNSEGHHPLPPYMGVSSGGGGDGGNCSTNNSCYSTPLSSPPKMGMPMPMQIMDHLVQEKFPTLGNTIALTSNLPAMPGDPGFAERAARFSSLGSRSFSGRTTQFIVNNNSNGEFVCRSNNNNTNNICENGKLQRVFSSPSLKAAGSLAENNKNSLLLQNNDRKQAGKCGEDQGELPNSNSRENGSYRKRKVIASMGKTKETQSQFPLSSNTKVAQNVEDSSAKRSKLEEGGELKTEENRVDDGKKEDNVNQKAPETPKEYIHVRARRGQATDSHSLAERVRREKISERMKLLQDLVPGCDKVTGKALMLDEIINYVQSLQRQVEFLSMKLAYVNPRLEFNMENLFSKDVIQPNSSFPDPMYPLVYSAPTLYGQPPQNPLQDSTPTMGPCQLGPLNPTINQNNALHIPTIDGYSNGLPRLPSLCEGDLQSVVQMGFGQKENGYQSQPLHGSNTSPLMKIEF